MDESELRRLLDVPPTTNTDDVLKLIQAEGFTPCPMKERYGENVVYICPLQKGIFNTVQARSDPDFPGIKQLVHEGFESASLAALNGLRIARGVARQKE